MNNRPSRARFSKGPPKSTKPSQSSSSSSSPSSSSQTKKRVIDKIVHRTRRDQQKEQEPSAIMIATTEEALKHVDTSKFDELKLSEHLMQILYNLLKDLRVLTVSDGVEDHNDSTSSTSARQNADDGNE